MYAGADDRCRCDSWLAFGEGSRMPPLDLSDSALAPVRKTYGFVTPITDLMRTLSDGMLIRRYLLSLLVAPCVLATIATCFLLYPKYHKRQMLGLLCNGR
eukprot:6214732-Pyramimonas_sp.AAC.1